MTDLYITVGVGGVGKTTVSAAFALYQARMGHKTLVITIDPSRRLAQDLGLDPNAAEPTQVGSFSLWGLVMNVERTFDRVIRRFAPDAGTAQQIIDSAIYQHMVKTLVGTHEYMAVEMLHEKMHSGDWDVIILDTPPSKHVLDFFEAPSKLMRFFGGASARWFARMAKGTRIVVKAFKIFWGGHFLEEVVTFFGRMEGYFGGFTSRSKEVFDVFHSERSRIVFVTTPERLDLNETRNLQQAVSTQGKAATQIIVNRVLPRLNPPWPLDRLERAGLSPSVIQEWNKTYDTLLQKSKQQWERIEKQPGVVALTQVDFEISDVSGLERLSRQFDSRPELSISK